MAYRVEELLALRDSVSESAISLDKIDKEQALRGNLIFYLCQTYLLPAFRFPFISLSQFLLNVCLLHGDFEGLHSSFDSGSFLPIHIPIMIYTIMIVT